MSQIDRTGDGIRVRLENEESALVRTLMEQLVELLGEPAEPAEPGEPGGAEQEPAGLAELNAQLGIADRGKPADPVLERLFPDGYQDDSDAAGEFRRYTEIGLRDGKREAAAVVLATLGSAASEGVVLDREQAQAWLRALNDVRLALGTRLDITEEWYEQAAQLSWDDPRYAMYAAYDWLTMLQESMVRAVW